MRPPFALCLFSLTLAAPIPAHAADAAAPIRALILDGQNNHAWKATTPVLKDILESSGRFAVDVATSPAALPKGAPKEAAAAHEDEMAKFRPDLSKYPVVVSNYNGEPWSEAFNADFAKFVKEGGGFVVVHAADNAFPNWPEYNAMIGLGGWGGRTEKAGPYVRYTDGKVVRDETAGRGGSHGKRHEFAVQIIDPEHPVTKGMPASWKHTADELYDRLRGPAKNMTLLAVAHSDKAQGGTGENEPMMWTVTHGMGRIFHTPMGHDVTSLQCRGFASTLQRGTEWAATGRVTLPLPKDFPTATKASPRPGGK